MPRDGHRRAKERASGCRRRGWFCLASVYLWLGSRCRSRVMAEGQRGADDDGKGSAAPTVQERVGVIVLIVIAAAVTVLAVAAAVAVLFEWVSNTR